MIKVHSEAKARCSRAQVKALLRRASALAILCGCAFVSFAQEAAPEGAPPPLHTLHVYTNLAQVPVLALSLQQTPLFGKLDLTRFRISLDSGPPFAPTYVRQEGDDPLALAVLIDTTQARADLLPHLPAAVAALAKNTLTAQDRVSVYANDCSFMQTGYALSATSDRLVKSLAAAVEPWIYRDKRLGTGRCEPTISFSQAVNSALAGLAAQTGRRVLLVVTDGSTADAMDHFKLIIQNAQRNSIAVFGLSMESSARLAVRPRSVYLLDLNRSSGVEDRFRLLCELSGGLRLYAEPRDLKGSLKDFIGTLRARYILEFPRGREDQAGTHSFAVTYTRQHLYLAPTGITMASATEDERHGVGTRAAEATTVPPQPGPRRVLTPELPPK